MMDFFQLNGKLNYLQFQMIRQNVKFKLKTEQSLQINKKSMYGRRICGFLYRYMCDRYGRIAQENLLFLCFHSGDNRLKGGICNRVQANTFLSKIFTSNMFQRRGYF